MSSEKKSPMALVSKKEEKEYEGELQEIKKTAAQTVKENKKLGETALKSLAAPIILTTTLLKDNVKPPVIYVYQKGKDIIIEVREKIQPYIKTIKAVIDKLRFKLNNPSMNYPGLCNNVKLRILGLPGEGDSKTKKGALADIKDKPDVLSNKTKKGGEESEEEGKEEKPKMKNQKKKEKKKSPKLEESEKEEEEKPKIEGRRKRRKAQNRRIRRRRKRRKAQNRRRRREKNNRRIRKRTSTRRYGER